VDETMGIRTGIREGLYSVALAVREALTKPHLHMMLVTKCAKFLARLGSRHRPSFRTLPNVLQSKTVCQWNTPVPLDFGDVPQFVLSYASGVQLSRVYSLKLPRLGGLEMVDCKPRSAYATSSRSAQERLRKIA
jgi:hypothetical protein